MSDYIWRPIRAGESFLVVAYLVTVPVDVLKSLGRVVCTVVTLAFLGGGGDGLLLFLDAITQF